MAAKLIYLTDEEFEIVAYCTKKVSGLDRINLEHKLIFVRDKFKEKEMPTKHIMTRVEAIELVKKHLPEVWSSADRVVDFYIEAGMLEIKEEENKKGKLYKKLTRYIPQAEIDQIWQEINEIDS